MVPKYTPTESHKEVVSDRRGCIKHGQIDNLLDNTGQRKVSGYERGICKKIDNFQQSDGIQSTFIEI